MTNETYDPPEVKTCDSCRWWGQTAFMPKRRGDKRACEFITGLSNEGVSAVHDGNFQSELFTGDKFGCIHHKVKEND